MKKINASLLSICTVVLLSCGGDKNQQEDEQTTQEQSTETTQETAIEEVKSPARQAMENIGATHVQIQYNAPSMRGREIFGGLVPYNEVWVTGAHDATSVQFDSNVQLNGNKVEKGKYGLFTIPGESEWTVILNENYEQHLTDDYNAEFDVIRFQVTPKKLSNTQEQLQFKVIPIEGNHGEIAFAWADVKLVINIEGI